MGGKWRSRGGRGEVARRAGSGQSRARCDTRDCRVCRAAITVGEGGGEARYKDVSVPKTHSLSKPSRGLHGPAPPGPTQSTSKLLRGEARHPLPSAPAESAIGNPLHSHGRALPTHREPRAMSTFDVSASGRREEEHTGSSDFIVRCIAQDVCMDGCWLVRCSHHSRRCTVS